MVTTACDLCQDEFHEDELHPSGDRLLCDDCILEEPRESARSPQDARAVALHWLTALAVWHVAVAIFVGIGASPFAPAWAGASVLLWILRGGRLAMSTRYRLAAAVMVTHVAAELAFFGGAALIVSFSPPRMIALALLVAGWRKASTAPLPRATVKTAPSPRE